MPEHLKLSLKRNCWGLNLIMIGKIRIKILILVVTSKFSL